MREYFRRFASWNSATIGTPTAFALAVLFCVLWAVSGPLFDYSDTWQLVINTATTVLTFLMLFVLQYTQNRDTKAIQLKLDALILATNEVSDEIADLENQDDENLARIEKAIKK